MTPTKKFEDTNKVSPFIDPEICAYEITISPNNQFQFEDKRDNRLPMWSRAIDSLLKKCLTDQDYRLYTDITFPHININREKNMFPRLHLHGILYFTCHKQVSKFWVSQLYQLSRWTNVTVNPLRNEKEFLEYSKKAMPLLCNEIPYKFLKFRRKRPAKKPRIRGTDTIHITEHALACSVD